jgi:hypothetical protein
MMVSLPTARLAPLTVRDAVAFAPDAASASVPKETFPSVNVTVPVGAAVPLAGFTVTVNTVETLWAMLPRLAATVAVVAICEAPTVTVTDVEADAVKLPAPA